MRWKPYLIGVICGGVLAVGALFICLALIGIGSRPGVHWGGGGVAVVEIDGGIYVADEIVAELEEARRTEHVKAVVLRINSPGGAVGASQEIYKAAMALNGVKPVVASMGQVAASGGYYVALPARQIFAMPGTITGSIGVRMSVMDAGELFRWARLAPEVLKSGRYKDAGSLYRPLSVEERALFAGILEDMHGQFKAAVVSSRQLPADLVDRTRCNCRSWFIGRNRWRTEGSAAQAAQALVGRFCLGGCRHLVAPGGRCGARRAVRATYWVLGLLRKGGGGEQERSGRNGG
ncbi:MAG: S49 family peptidase [Deltaproteobacteria bacterium]|nr:S49 family peptidase [Deltaproteobacteria bacterium]